MGAFIISDISFKTKKDKDRFEKKLNIKKRDILVDEDSNSAGFGAWLMNRNPELDVIYYLGFMGYADPEEILRDCLKEGIKIKFWAFIPINDRQAEWKKIRGRW